MRPEQNLLTNGLFAEFATKPGGNRQVADLRIEGIPGKTTPDQSTAPILPCPWCSAPVEQKKFGKHTRTFCDKDCKNAYNNALGWLGRFIGRCATEPGLLQAAVSSIASIVPRRESD